jgi:hypothetical protein
MHRTIMPISLSEKAGRGMGFVTSKGVRGTLSWKEWLRRHFAEAQTAA